MDSHLLGSLGGDACAYGARVTLLSWLSHWAYHPIDTVLPYDHSCSHLSNQLQVYMKYVINANISARLCWPSSWPAWWKYSLAETLALIIYTCHWLDNEWSWCKQPTKKYWISFTIYIFFANFEWTNWLLFVQIPTLHHLMCKLCMLGEEKPPSLGSFRCLKTKMEWLYTTSS